MVTMTSLSSAVLDVLQNVNFSLKIFKDIYDLVEVRRILSPCTVLVNRYGVIARTVNFRIFDLANKGLGSERSG